MKPSLIAAIVLAFLLLILVLQNTEVVTVRFFFWDFQMSRVVLILITTLIGFLCGYLVARLFDSGKGRDIGAGRPGGGGAGPAGPGGSAGVPPRAGF
jgi:ABC-type multidrug transport system permease subunit